METFPSVLLPWWEEEVEEGKDPFPFRERIEVRVNDPHPSSPASGPGARHEKKALNPHPRSVNLQSIA